MEPTIQRLSSRVTAQARDTRVMRERRTKQESGQTFELPDDEAPARAPEHAERSASAPSAREEGVGLKIDLVA